MVQRSSTRRSRRARRTCSTRTRPTASPTSRTSARSAAPTCAPRSSSTPRPRRSPCATSRRSRCRASWSTTAPSTDGPEASGDFTTPSCTVTKNLNRVIDRNALPVEEARRSNMRHRPVGIGVQGLADVFILLRLPFDSTSARARSTGHLRDHLLRGARGLVRPRQGARRAYETYAGSPASQGRAAVRHVGRRRRRARLGLGRAARAIARARRAQLAAGRADADRVDGADPRQQRVLRAVHVQHLLAARARGRVRRRQPAPAARPHGARLWTERSATRSSRTTARCRTSPRSPTTSSELYKHVRGRSSIARSSTWPPTAARSSTSRSRSTSSSTSPTTRSSRRCTSTGGRRASTRMTCSRFRGSPLPRLSFICSE